MRGGVIPGELVTLEEEGRAPTGSRYLSVFHPPPALLLTPTGAQSWSKEIDSFRGRTGGKRSLSFQAGMRRVKIHSCETGLK